MDIEEGRTLGNNGETPGIKESDGSIPPPPVFMQDDPPQTGKKMDTIKWGLMHGKTEEELVDIGYNKKTVSMAAYDLDKEGYRPRPAKKRATKKAVVPTDGTTAAVVEYQKRALTSPTKATPPEFLIDQIALPLDGGQAKNFETGMKFGLRVAVLGVRMAQELGNMGMQQVNPIIAMANAMRQGEAEAAKSAAAEAAILAAGEVRDQMTPILTTLGTKGSSAVSTDPVKKMLVDMFTPMLQKMFSMVMPGVTGAQQANVPDGWTRKSTEE